MAGDAERARLEQRQAPGQGNDPVGGKTPVLRVAAVVFGAQAEAVHDDLVALLVAWIRRLLDAPARSMPATSGNLSAIFALPRAVSASL